MKITLPAILFLVLSINLFSQTGIWMIPVTADQRNFRTVDAVALDSITINCPTTGKVFVRFDGNCFSSPGDRIVLAASNYRDWQTNDGNISVTVEDPEHTLNCFDHTRVYDILEPAMRTFYAIVHNYVDYGGTGLASIQGHLTVEFIPDSSPETISGIGINDCCWNWDNDSHATYVFPGTSIESASAGNLLVSLEGYVEMPRLSQFYYTTNLEPAWPASPVVFQVTMAEGNSESTVVHREIFPVTSGSHSVYPLVKIVNGDSASTNKYLLSSLTAQFIPDDNPGIQLQSQRLDHLNVEATGVLELGQLQVTNAVAGKAWLQFSGRFHTTYADRIKVWLRPASFPDSIISDILLQPTFTYHPDVHFSLSGIQDITPGIHTYDVMMEYDSISAGTLTGYFSGLYTLQFIANGIPSKVNDLSAHDVFSVYPNPTTGNVYVHSSSFDNRSPIEITIMNSSGQLINHQTVADLNQYCDDLSDLPDGEYVVQIKQGTVVGVRSLMKTGYK